MKNLVTQIKTLSKNEIYTIIIVISAFISVFLVTALLLLFPVYVLMTKQYKMFIPKNKSSYSLIVFIFIGLISTFLFSKDADLFGTIIKSDYLKALSVILLILPLDIFFMQNTITRKAFNISLKSALFMSIVTFLVAAFQKVFLLYADPERPGRYASTFMNENYYGMMIEFIVIIAFYFIFKKQDKFSFIFLGLTVVFNIAGLWLCQSRTAYLGLSLAILIVFSIKNKHIFFGLATAFLFFAIVIYNFPSLLPRFDSSLEYLNYRFGIWNAAMLSIKDNLLIGRGYFSYSGICCEYCTDVTYYALHSHNMYIELLLNFGILGFISLSVYLFATLKDTIKNAKALGKNELILIIATLFIVLFHGLADTTIFWPQTAVIAAYILLFPNVYESEN